MPEQRLKIAVFIDFDNIEIGVKNTLNAQFDIGIVLEALKERGDVVTKTAYGDWTRAGDYSRSLTQHATKLVQRNLTPGGDKNGADINLALDALEMAFTHTHINGYVIVGGDSDFISLVEKLKQYDKQIFVVGGRSFTSQVMQRNCHEFIAYENLIGGRGRGDRGGARTVGPGRVAGADRAGHAADAARAQDAHRPRGHAAARPAQEHAAAARLDVLGARPTASSSFRDFAEKLATAGFVTLRESGRNILVELKEDGHHPPRQQEPRAAAARAPQRRAAARGRGPTKRRSRRAGAVPAAKRRAWSRRSPKSGGCSSRRRTRRAGRCTSGR